MYHQIAAELGSSSNEGWTVISSLSVESSCHLAVVFAFAVKHSLERNNWTQKCSLTSNYIEEGACTFVVQILPWPSLEFDIFLYLHSLSTSDRWATRVFVMFQIVPRSRYICTKVPRMVCSQNSLGRLSCFQVSIGQARFAKLTTCRSGVLDCFISRYSLCSSSEASWQQFSCVKDHMRIDASS